LDRQGVTPRNLAGLQIALRAILGPRRRLVVAAGLEAAVAAAATGSTTIGSWGFVGCIAVGLCGCQGCPC